MQPPPEDPFEFDDWLEATALPPEEPAGFLAQRVLNEHGLTGPLDFAQIQAIADQRGILVYVEAEFDPTGLCARWEGVIDPVIVVRGYCPFTLAHELYHALVRDNARRGIVYHMHHFADTPAEDAANLFAFILTHAPGELPSNAHFGNWDEPELDEWFDEEQG